MYADLHKWSFAIPRVPILHVQGTDDGAMQAGYAEAVTDVLPEGSRMVMIPAAGHFLQIERPDATAAAVLDYLGDRRGPR
jgi:pimeloyl-ACP methyl ester carboxylesterase